ncbi:MAG: 23S rRNA (adenine(2503)-C(2))-methyltransferase RlmN [Nitrospirae bacterium]|nr:23S rRNA (adenine(2503)-C(2))-methyltransferase RlmN [Nitrospirota bacterium]
MNLLPDLRGLTPVGMAELCVSLGGTPHQARAVSRAVFRDGVESLSELPVAARLRALLAGRCRISTLGIDTRLKSDDGTEKFLYRLQDGETVEGVLIPERARRTLCVSTQVGCRSACRFCVTGMSGFVRSLSAAEMAGQVIAAQKVAGCRVTNIVLMGCGEPLDNFDAVSRFACIAVDPLAFGIPPGRITLSTSGITPEIARMPRELDVRLAVSLNAADDETRSRIMPINRKYPLAKLMQALRAYGETGRRVLIEYVLLAGVNDSASDAEKLAALLQELNCMVNLLLFNPQTDLPYRRPDELSARRFQRVLLDAGFVSVVRDSRGIDIAAACGQLRAATA